MSSAWGYDTGDYQTLVFWNSAACNATAIFIVLADILLNLDFSTKTWFFLLIKEAILAMATSLTADLIVHQKK